MKQSKIIYLVIIILLVIGSFVIVEENKSPKDGNQYTKNLIEYSNSVYGISFKYPMNYSLHETDADGSDLRKHHIISLINKDNLPVPINSEGPPSISIDIYQNNLDNKTTKEWILGSNFSNFKLSDGRMATTSINGLPSLSYRWSGLYEGTTIAIAKPNWVYSFSVTYLEMGAQIIQDFVLIKNSIKISD